MEAGRRVGEQRVCSLLVPCTTQKSAARDMSQFFNSLLTQPRNLPTLKAHAGDGREVAIPAKNRKLVLDCKGCDPSVILRYGSSRVPELLTHLCIRLDGLAIHWEHLSHLLKFIQNGRKPCFLKRS